MLHLELGPLRLFVVWRDRYYHAETDRYCGRGVRLGWCPQGWPAWRWSRGLAWSQPGVPA